MNTFPKNKKNQNPRDKKTLKSIHGQEVTSNFKMFIY